jgi:NAD(P)-dependent dehydrogenase (short-subunit alcohol dehydrogenase family)
MARSVLVTGAADGIGRGIATLFAQCGDRVALLDYDADKLEHTTGELARSGAEVLALQADVRDAAAVEAAVGQAAERHAGVDIAISNAAIYPNTPVVDMSEAEWDLVLDTNLKGAFLFTRACARAMIRQARGGKLCLIASGAYRSARRGAAHYCASKAGLVLLAQTLALELAEHQINVNVVAPGFIEVGPRPGVSRAYRETISTTSRGAASAARTRLRARSSSCARPRPSSSPAASCRSTAGPLPGGFTCRSAAPDLRERDSQAPGQVFLSRPGLPDGPAKEVERVLPGDLPNRGILVPAGDQPANEVVAIGR